MQHKTSKHLNWTTWFMWHDVHWFTWSFTFVNIWFWWYLGKVGEVSSWRWNQVCESRLRSCGTIQTVLRNFQRMYCQTYLVLVWFIAWFIWGIIDLSHPNISNVMIIWCKKYQIVVGSYVVVLPLNQSHCWF